MGKAPRDYKTTSVSHEHEDLWRVSELRGVGEGSSVLCL